MKKLSNTEAEFKKAMLMKNVYIGFCNSNFARKLKESINYKNVECHC